eukprot:1613168-Amphidinium_carterae.2
MTKNVSAPSSSKKRKSSRRQSLWNNASRAHSLSAIHIRTMNHSPNLRLSIKCIGQLLVMLYSDPAATFESSIPQHVMRNTSLSGPSRW